MTTQNNKKSTNKMTGAQSATVVVVILVLLVATGYFIFSRSRHAVERSINVGDKPAISTPQSVVPNAPVPAPLPKVKPPSDVPVPPATSPPAAQPQREKIYHQEKEQPQLKKSQEPAIFQGVGQLAIIIDDMGSSLTEARSLAKIGVPLTFSIIPGLHSYRDVASFASAHGIETMIHIPMQSKGWPGRRLEANGLLVSMIDDELRERIAGFIRDVPGAVGVNNHMGSEFTEHEDKMRRVLEALQGKNLFFIDSVTSPGTSGLRIARELGVKSGRRNVFLDNKQERSYILAQLAQAAKLAKKTGSAIAICHPHPATIATLAESLPGLERQGVTLVPVSRLVR